MFCVFIYLRKRLHLLDSHNSNTFWRRLILKAVYKAKGLALLSVTKPSSAFQKKKTAASLLVGFSGRKRITSCFRSHTRCFQALIGGRVVRCTYNIVTCRILTSSYKSSLKTDTYGSHCKTTAPVKPRSNDIRDDVVGIL